MLFVNKMIMPLGCSILDYPILGYSILGVTGMEHLLFLFL